jgi:hypothetical protein
MKPFLPKRAEPLAFAFLVSGMMTFFVSGISTAMALGFSPGMPGKWLAAWALSWAIAFPILIFVAPLVRRLLPAIVRRD